MWKLYNFGVLFDFTSTSVFTLRSCGKIGLHRRGALMPVNYIPNMSLTPANKSADVGIVGAFNYLH